MAWRGLHAVRVLGIVCAAGISCTIATTPREGGDGGTASDAGNDGTLPDGSPADGSPSDGSPGDGTAQDGGSNITRTLVYHQVLSPASNVDDGEGLAFSRDGSRVVFAWDDGNGEHVAVAKADGSGFTEIESAPRFGERFAISGDGALLTYGGSIGNLRIASTDGTTLAPRDLLTVDGRSPRFARDPSKPQSWKVYFVLKSDAGTMARGIYSVNADGSGLQLLLSASDVAALTGVTVDKIKPDGFDTSGSLSLDVSSDGTRFVSSWDNTDYVSAQYAIAATTNGTTKTLVWKNTASDSVDQVALSGDGNTIVLRTTNNYHMRSMRFDGSGVVDLGDSTIDQADGWGLSDDGKLLVADCALVNTDGSGLVDIGSFESGNVGGDPHLVSCTQARISGKGDRVLYVDNRANPSYLATIDVDPASPGAAPGVSQLAISPSSVSPGDPAATVGAKVTSTAAPGRVGSAILIAGRQDTTGNCVSGNQVMYDDGTHGDQVAGDGIFTDNEIGIGSCAAAGARTVRVRAQVQASDGRQHATVVDFGPFTVK